MTKSKAKRTGFTLFAGGDGVGIAMQMLGVVPVGGIEWDDEIAAVARANGFDVTTADILQCNPAQFPTKSGVKIDWLHASPPCPNFSVAKAGARETANDLALARKVADFVSFHLPSVFTLENVYKYRKSHSMLLIGLTLQQLGYKYIWKHINFADYGVAQTRRRFVLVARRDGVAPTIAMPTRQKSPDLFSKKWIGWHESIADLIPGLPTAYHQKGRPCEHDPNGRECRQSPHCVGHFADWQMKRLPDEFADSWMCEVANGTGGADREGAEPSATVLSAGGGRVYRAFVKGSGERSEGFYTNLNNAGRQFTVNEASEPAATHEEKSRMPNAFITDRLNSSASKPNRTADEPAMTVVCYSPKHQAPNGYANGRIVKMTPRALLRFQSFPDWYKVPATAVWQQETGQAFLSIDEETHTNVNGTLAVKICGNAVPPVGLAGVMRGVFD